MVDTDAFYAAINSIRKAARMRRLGEWEKRAAITGGSAPSRGSLRIRVERSSRHTRAER